MLRAQAAVVGAALVRLGQLRRRLARFLGPVPAGQPRGAVPETGAEFAVLGGEQRVGAATYPSVQVIWSVTTLVIIAEVLAGR